MAKSKSVSAARKPARKISKPKISKSTKKTALEVAALGAGALAVGKAYSTAKFVAKAGLVVAAAAAAAAFIPKSMQKEVADAVSEAAHTALEKAKSIRG